MAQQPDPSVPTRRRYRAGVVALCCTLTATAVAQTVPGAGAIQQERQRSIDNEPHAKPPPPSLAPLPDEMRPRAGITVVVNEFAFAGNSRLSKAQLTAIVAPWIGRTLDFSDLQQVTNAVMQAYRKAGWVARVYLPEQDVTHGTVLLQIVEATFGGARLQGTQPQRVSADRWQKTVAAAIAPGDPVSVAALDRAILLVDDLPGVTASGNLTPGPHDGETSLLLKLNDEPWINGDLGIDDTSARATGANRIFANLQANSPLGWGDEAKANLIHTSGSEYGRVSYTLPVGYSGARFGANASALTYDLVPAEYAALDAKGTSHSEGLEGSYPLIRSRLANLYAYVNYDHKQFNNRATGATTSDYLINAYSLSFLANRFDDLGGGGSNTANLGLERGRLDAHEVRTDDSAGGFTIVRYGLSRRQTLSANWSAYAALSGQAASNNLDSAERFYLGGVYGVRAYPQNEGGGSDGQLLDLELRQSLPLSFSLTEFYDYGHITQFHDRSGGTGAVLSGANPNSFDLQGAGLAALWASSTGLNLKATWAHRIGRNPDPTLTGTDQDGSLTRNRFWLIADWTF